MDLSDSVEGKIHLSAKDVQYLQAQVLAAANEKLNVNLPETQSEGAGEGDPLRDKVVSLLEEFVYESYEQMRYSLVVDSKDMAKAASLRDEISTVKEEVEPFDLALNEKLRQLYGEYELMTLEVTEQRKTIPRTAELRFQELVEGSKKQLEVEISESLSNDELLAKLQDEKIRNLLQSVADSKPENLIARIPDIISDFEESVTLLSKLNTTLPDQNAQLGKLVESVNYLRELYRKQQASSADSAVESVGAEG